MEIPYKCLCRYFVLTQSKKLSEKSTVRGHFYGFGTSSQMYRPASHSGEVLSLILQGLCVHTPAQLLGHKKDSELLLYILPLSFHFLNWSDEKVVASASQRPCKSKAAGRDYCEGGDSMAAESA